MRKLLLQTLHEVLRPVAWHDYCPNGLFYAWCRLGDAAYR